MRILIIILITVGAEAIHAQSLSIENWQAPFANALDRLRRGAWEQPLRKKDNFGKDTGKLWNMFKNYRSDWQPLLRRPENLTTLFSSREEFSKKSYVDKVFPTKEQTLIVVTKRYPNIIIKIDNRPQIEFNELFRSYFDAFMKTDFIKQFSMFSYLYLPMEVGRESREIGAKVVFSERIPLFSDAEIDNRILLHRLLLQIERDEKLKEQVKKLYSQVISYICRVNFDDINHRNVPFTVDGRLSPFDTDSMVAGTGVHSFLSQFFGYRVLSLDEVSKLVELRCTEPYSSDIKKITDYYNDTQRYENKFAINERVINGIIQFLQQRGTRVVKFKKFITGDDKKYARKLDKVVRKKIIEPNRTVFGTRCEHISDFIMRSSLEIKKVAPELSNDDVDDKIRDILRRGKTRNKIYSEIEIDNLMSNATDLRSFICF